MNKELEALKEARNFRHEKDKNLVVIDIDYFNRCLNGIETELKRLIYLEERVDDLKKTREELQAHNQMLLKYFKALEIIKNKEMLSVFKDINGKCFICFNTTAIEIPQEEYDLLKEVLL